MPEKWTQSFIDKAFWLHRQKPVYRSDWRIKPDAPLTEGVDCSRLVYLAAHMAGIPGIERTDASSMRKGLGGWRGRDIPGGLRNAKPGTIPFYKWRDPKTRKPKSKKPIDHTGIHVRDPSTGDPSVIHASSGRGETVLVPISGVFVRDLECVRELTIGDR